ncbi:MAG TPA: hypothetical protein VIC57_02195 [Candidatus Dormibacteraeota bacterium]
MTEPLILDSGALLALRRRSSGVWALLDRAQRAKAPVLVPAGVLAQTARGGPRDRDINAVLGRDGTVVSAHDEERARSAGWLLGRAGMSDAVDALVVAEALRHPSATIVTSDPNDIATLAHGYRRVKVVRV